MLAHLKICLQRQGEGNWATTITKPPVSTIFSVAPSAKLNFYSDKFDARCLSWLKSGCLSNIEVSLPRIVSPQTADFRASFGENHSLTHFGPMKALKCYTQQESFEKRWTPSCIGEILIQKHNQSPEPYGIQRFNKIDAMNLIFANFDTAKHPILAQNMPFWAFKSLPTDPLGQPPALKDLRKNVATNKKGDPFSLPKQDQ